ncbi:MAG TPA: hypothetical protein VIM57_02555 [Luteolibacter sp.]
MKSRAFIALLLLFLWTFVPGMNVACGGSPAKSCPPAERCGCCEDKPCVCEAPAPGKNERPVATPSPELKLPLVLPSEPLWNAVPVEAPVIPQCVAAQAASVAYTTGDVRTRFCTFLL